MCLLWSYSSTTTPNSPSSTRTASASPPPTWATRRTSSPVSVRRTMAQPRSSVAWGLRVSSRASSPASSERRISRRWARAREARAVRSLVLFPCFSQKGICQGGVNTKTKGLKLLNVLPE